jgi:hypothetical protein
MRDSDIREALVSGGAAVGWAKRLLAERRGMEQ